jgi:hypothetical protein
VVNAVVAGVACLAALLALEIAFHVIRPHVLYAYFPQQIYSSHFVASTLIPFELRPNLHARFSMVEFDTTVSTNRLGLRAPEVDYTRPRILCMGDSMTFGYGVENNETFCSVLEALFGGKYQFLDAAFADSYSPDTYALWLRARGAALAPTGIIVTIHNSDYGEVAGNRWLRDGREMTDDDPGTPDRIEAPGMFVTPDGAWLGDSHVAHFPAWLRRLVKRSYLVGLIRDRFVHDIQIPADAQDAAVVASEDRRFLRSLEMLRAAAGDRLITLYRIYGKQEYDGVPRPSIVRMDRLLEGFAAEHDIRLVSNRDEFQRPGDFFRLDGHWNASGHRRVAAFLHRTLVAWGY